MNRRPSGYEGVSAKIPWTDCRKQHGMDDISTYLSIFHPVSSNWCVGVFPVVGQEMGQASYSALARSPFRYSFRNTLGDPKNSRSECEKLYLPLAFRPIALPCIRDPPLETAISSSSASTCCLSHCQGSVELSRHHLDEYRPIGLYDPRDLLH